MIPKPEDTFSIRSLHVILDHVDVAFDDQRSVANAGLLLSARLAERLTGQLVELRCLRPEPLRPVRDATVQTRQRIWSGIRPS
jgi:hypothetical protein